MKVLKAKVSELKCKKCGFCKESVCPSIDYCIGCGACYLACPYEAVELTEHESKEEVAIKIDNEKYSVPARITVKKALELAGYKIFAPCEVGGCYSCTVLVDNEVERSCVTTVKDGMEILTQIPNDYIPKRIVHGFTPHLVGGVGTPWELKNLGGYIEVACFAAGCNLRCPQCQNWTTTYCGKDIALTPKVTAEMMTRARKEFRVDRMAISGGEPTLNRKWLLQYVRELKKLNPDKDARIHLDTNATILTEDYIDKLVNAGMTDIGIDLKGLELATFQKITGLKNKELAEKYLTTEWHALKYSVDKYSEKVFVGAGIPYNKDFMSFEELRKIGEKIRSIDENIQVCALDYRGEFRSKIARPSYSEMLKVWRILHEIGLKTVICQTPFGHLGPEL
ncbi:MAG: radical SAM protein [Candidatus Thermoplasmatota archaeon]